MVYGNSRIVRTVLAVILFVILFAFRLRIRNSPGATYTRHINSGQSYYWSNRFAESIPEYDSAIAIRPDYYEGYFYRAVAESKLNRNKAAIRDDTKAISLCQTPIILAHTYYNRGLDYDALGDFVKAEADYTNALLRTPNNWSAILSRADCYRRMSKPKLVISDINRYHKLKPPIGWSYFLRGASYIELHDWQHAIDDLKQASALLPNDPASVGDLGWALYCNGDLAGAIDADKRALQLAPGLAIWQFNLALCYARNNDVSMAKNEYESAVKTATPGDIKSALADIESGLRSSPSSTGLKAGRSILQDAAHSSSNRQ